VLHEVRLPEKGNGYQLCLPYGFWHHDDQPREEGYRFMWRHHGAIQPNMGQPRIPSLRQVRELMSPAEQEGWAELDAGR
jgi:hypothetical protein